MYAQRLQQLKERFAENDLGALLVTSLPNIYYLSGFTGSTAILLLTKEHNYFITDGRYTVQVSTRRFPGMSAREPTVFIPEPALTCRPAAEPPPASSWPATWTTSPGTTRWISPRATAASWMGISCRCSMAGRRTTSRTP